MVIISANIFTSIYQWIYIFFFDIKEFVDFQKDKYISELKIIELMSSNLLLEKKAISQDIYTCNRSIHV